MHGLVESREAFEKRKDLGAFPCHISLSPHWARPTYSQVTQAVGRYLGAELLRRIKG
jgi:hypothetical protein